MTSARITWSGVLIMLVIGPGSVTRAGELPKSATVLDPDCIFYLWPYPTISPDGEWVAYVSKGHVCVCNINTPAPRQVMEVPHSWTWPNFVIKKRDSSLKGSFDDFRGLSRDERNELHAQLTNTVYGLTWTYDSAGFVFGVQSYDAEQKTSTSDGYFASVDGDITKLAHVGPDALTRGLVTGTLSRDRKYLVSELQEAHPGYRPLIWDVKKNKPRATCYLYLTPSKTSARSIGIEKDSRQLVIVDEQFDVIKRFDETMPDRSFGFRLDWSPNERFIIWRNQIGFDHFSNWKGFHLDLETGAKRELEGRFMDELVAFTGHGGEFLRCGQNGARSKFVSGDQITGAHLTIVPEGEGPPHDVWRITVDPNKPMPGMLTNRPGNPPLRMSPNGNLFAIGLPRPVGKLSGCIWHLINREGSTWQLPGEDNGEYVSPYELAGFADNGKLIVAYDRTRLFAFPVSEVGNDENEVKQ